MIAIAVSPDGSRIVSGSRAVDGPESLAETTIRLWEAHTGQSLGEPLQGHGALVVAVAFSPEGSRVASGSCDFTIRLWDADTGRPFGEPLRGHSGPINTFKFSPDGSRIVSSSLDGTIRFWDTNTGRPLGSPLLGHKSMINAVAFSPDGSRIVSGSSDKTIRVWNAETDAISKSSNRNEEAHSGSSSPTDDSKGTLVPGFDRCSLSQDGWVQSSSKYLFWVPPDNRHGLQHPRSLLTIPTKGRLRATKIDFSRFHCGPSWTNVRTDIDQ